MQTINYSADGKQVMVYHTDPSKAGSPDFEHKGMATLSAIPYGKKPDGTDDTDVLVLTCPICGATGVLPRDGGSEAQALFVACGK